jgi:signal transduction histidine kinase
MARVVQDSSMTSRRTVVIAVASATVVLLVIGFAFVNSSTMARVARDARTLHWVDSVEGAADLAVASAEHALSVEASNSALGRLQQTRGELVALTAGAEDYPAFPALARFVAPVEAILADVGDGNIAEARTLYDTVLEEAHQELGSALSDERASLRASVDSGTGIAAGWIEFALVLAIPLCVAGAFYILSRRWVAAVESRSGRELAAERELTRAKGAFVAGLSREIRTPLTSVYGFAQMMSRGEISGVEAMRETSQLIADESAEMKRIVDDALVASSIDTTGIEVAAEETRIGEVIDGSLAPFEQCGLVVRRNPTPAMVRTDPTLLGHVLTNLVANAVHHGGPEISIDVTTSDHSVDVEVADNGPGLPEAEVGNILERMSDVGPVLAEGSGLGLAVAARLAYLMGGSLRYQRYSGRTYFVVTLPAEVGVFEDAEETSIAEMIRTLSA